MHYQNPKCIKTVGAAIGTARPVIKSLHNFLADSNASHVLRLGEGFQLAGRLLTDSELFHQGEGNVLGAISIEERIRRALAIIR